MKAKTNSAFIVIQMLNLTIFFTEMVAYQSDSLLAIFFF